MTNGIIDDFELIQIQVAKCMLQFPLACAGQASLQPGFELSPIDQAG